MKSESLYNVKPQGGIATVNQQSSAQWNFGRFVKTLSYFGAIPVLSQLDWFQHWWGSQPDPKIDASTLAGLTAPDPAAGSTAEGRVILVVGATTPIGQQVVPYLQQQGYDLRAIAPPDTTAKASQETNLAAAVETIELATGQPVSSALSPPIAAIVYCLETGDRPAAAIDAALETLVQAINSESAQPPLFDFTQPATAMAEIWGALDDVVMGGVSQSQIQFGAVAAFAGNVSIANSGGFASVRTRNFQPPLNLSAYDGVELRVKGDGNRYKFMLRDETRWDGIAYSHSFDTAPNTWISIRIPFSQLVPVFRAKTVADRQLDPSQVCAFQLMLSKFEYDGALNPHFQPGPFQLQVEAIQGYRQILPQLVLVTPLRAA